MTTLSVELPTAADWSVGALVEQDYIGSNSAPLEADSTNTAMFELGAVPADRVRQLEEWACPVRGTASALTLESGTVPRFFPGW